MKVRDPGYDGRPYVQDTDYLLHEIRDLLIEMRDLLERIAS